MLMQGKRIEERVLPGEDFAPKLARHRYVAGGGERRGTASVHGPGDESSSICLVKIACGESPKRDKTIVITSFFSELSWARESEGSFRSYGHAATCPPVYHMRWRLHTVPFSTERQSREVVNTNLLVFGLTQLVIEPWSIASVAVAVSTRPQLVCH